MRSARASVRAPCAATLQWRARRSACRGRLRPFRPTAVLRENPAGRGAAVRLPEAGMAACPYTAARAALGLPAAAKPSAKQSGARVEDVPYPGPSTFWEHIATVIHIAVWGMERSTLHFLEQYGPICRFPNWTQLGGSAGWTFIYYPDDVEHVCGTNRRALYFYARLASLF